MAEPTQVETVDRVVIKRLVNVTWKPGDGPRIQIVTHVKGRRTVHEAALVLAQLTYVYESELQVWVPDADLTAVIPYRTGTTDGWSRFPTPAVGSNSPNRMDIARALHEQYRPTTTVTLTEQEKSA